MVARWENPGATGRGALPRQSGRLSVKAAGARANCAVGIGTNADAPRPLDVPAIAASNDRVTVRRRCSARLERLENCPRGLGPCANPGLRIDTNELDPRRHA